MPMYVFLRCGMQGRAQSSASPAAPVAASISPADGSGNLKSSKGRNSSKAKTQKRYKTSDDAILVMRKQLAAVGCKLFVSAG